MAFIVARGSLGKQGGRGERLRAWGTVGKQGGRGERLRAWGTERVPGQAGGEG